MDNVILKKVRTNYLMKIYDEDIIVGALTVNENSDLIFECYDKNKSLEYVSNSVIEFLNELVENSVLKNKVNYYFGNDVDTTQVIVDMNGIDVVIKQKMTVNEVMDEYKKGCEENQITLFKEFDEISEPSILFEELD